MAQPPGFIDPEFANHVCRLKKSIYRLKQAPWAWFSALHSFLCLYGFHVSKSDSSLFILNQGNILMLCTCICGWHFNYRLIYFSHPTLHFFFAPTILHQRFGFSSLFLGHRSYSYQYRSLLSQHKYICDLLERTKMAEAKDVQTPFSISTSLTLNDGTVIVDQAQYRSIIGNLQYIYPWLDQTLPNQSIG